ncbi:MAG TPA: farnesyl diphosphate synthase [Methyloceanibacter sp.]|nr:farnesyl diphosphate synthase [Methyloceanibacter sp.]
MDFLAELERIAGAVETRLGRILAGSLLGVPESARLGQAMRYAALGGGKRLRPFLLIESARLFGIGEEEALPAACALECVHCYSLVHDDLPAMDDDALRRGRPTVHIAFDEATAILAGDGLLTLAFEILADPADQGDASLRSELIFLLAKAAGWQGMVLGQALDLDAEGRQLGVEEVAKLQALKTGALFGFACEAGAVLGRANPKERTALLAYASAFGQAFQLADDLLDAEGDAALLGKAVAKDHKRGKATLVALLGTDAARIRLAEVVDSAEKALAPFGARADKLVAAARFVATRRS